MPSLVRMLSFVLERASRENETQDHVFRAGSACIVVASQVATDATTEDNVKHTKIAVRGSRGRCM